VRDAQSRPRPVDRRPRARALPRRGRGAGHGRRRPVETAAPVYAGIDQRHADARHGRGRARGRRLRRPRRKGGSMATTEVAVHSGPPLDPASAEEITAAVAAVRAHHGGRLRFVSVSLDEPAKDVVQAWQPGTPVPRRLEVVALAPDEGAAYIGFVD